MSTAPLLTIAQVAERLQVEHKTVRKAIRIGRLEAALSAEECAELVPTLGWWKKMVVGGFQPEIEQIWCAPGS